MEVLFTLLAERYERGSVMLTSNLPLAQSALVSLTSPMTVSEDQNRELEQFLSQLPRLWQRGEVRPTHRAAPAKARDYRTREDPFEGVWSQLLSWIEQEPDATSKMLFVRLQELHPGKFPAHWLHNCSVDFWHFLRDHRLRDSSQSPDCQ